MVVDEIINYSSSLFLKTEIRTNILNSLELMPGLHLSVLYATYITGSFSC